MVKNNLGALDAQLVDGVYAKQNKLVDAQKVMFVPPQSFILNRYLGLRKQIDGSAQWYESSTDAVGNT